MTLTTNYLSFWARVRKEFLTGFLVVTGIVLLTYVKQDNSFGVFVLIILIFGIVYMVIALSKVKTYINEVKFIDDKMIITGYDFDSRWDREIDIKTSTIKIKSEGRGRGNVEYFLRIISPRHIVDINRSFNWTYPSLLAIFHEFKRVKGERIIFDEKYFLDIMEKKAHGFSMWDIANGKEVKKEGKS